MTDPLGPIKRDCDTNHYKPIITVGVAFNHDNELYWGSTTRYRFLFSFLTKESKIKYDIIFYRSIWGPLRGIVTPTTIPIFTVGVTFNHGNEMYWGSTTRYRFLFSFLTQGLIMKYDIIFYRPLRGPLKMIVTPTTVCQY